MADALNNVIDIGLDLAEPFYRQKDFSVSCWSGKETRNIQLDPGHPLSNKFHFPRTTGFTNFGTKRGKVERDECRNATGEEACISSEQTNNNTM